MYQIIKKGEKYAIRRKILGLFWMYLAESSEPGLVWWFWPNGGSWFTRQTTAEAIVEGRIKERNEKRERRAFNKSRAEVVKDFHGTP